MKKIFAMLLVVAMMFAIAIPMSAEISPEPKPGVDTEIVPENGGEITEKDNGDGTITITINPSKGYDFVKWEIKGEYDLVSGKLTDKVVTIRPKTDVKAQAVMKTQTVVKPTPGPNNQSPSTGVAPVMMAVAFVGSMAAAGYSFKKSGK
ncbi:MAG: hypothetical protein IJB24_07670 [Clostridia bacterium]|nr:hypothetical protein [Clostridia bacterium]